MFRCGSLNRDDEVVGGCTRRGPETTNSFHLESARRYHAILIISSERAGLNDADDERRALLGG